MCKLLLPSSETVLSRVVCGQERTEDGDWFGLSIDVHGALEDLFGDANLEVVEREGKSIRTRARETIRLLNQTPESHDSLKLLIEIVVEPSRYWQNGWHEQVVERLNRTLRGDGFELREVNHRWRLLSKSQFTGVTESLEGKLDSLDFDSVEKDFERALNEAESDPEDAVTSACSTVESVCKCILDEMGVPYPSKQDIKHLFKAVQENLDLSPTRPEIEEDIKRILGALINVASGIGSLRTKSGDAHGRGKKSHRIDARISRLAIHSASTLTHFLIETWQKRGAGTQ